MYFARALPAVHSLCIPHRMMSLAHELLPEHVAHTSSVAGASHHQHAEAAVLIFHGRSGKDSHLSHRCRSSGWRASGRSCWRCGCCLGQSSRCPGLIPSTDWPLCRWTCPPVQHHSQLCFHPSHLSASGSAECAGAKLIVGPLVNLLPGSKELVPYPQPSALCM